jgi:hypothetical protein
MSVAFVGASGLAGCSTTTREPRKQFDSRLGAVTGHYGLRRAMETRGPGGRAPATMCAARWSQGGQPLWNIQNLSVSDSKFKTSLKRSCPILRL